MATGEGDDIGRRTIIALLGGGAATAAGAGAFTYLTDPNSGESGEQTEDPSVIGGTARETAMEEPTSDSSTRTEEYSEPTDTQTQQHNSVVGTAADQMLSGQEIVELARPIFTNVNQSSANLDGMPKDVPLEIIGSYGQPLHDIAPGFGLNADTVGELADQGMKETSTNQYLGTTLVTGETDQIWNSLNGYERILDETADLEYTDPKVILSKEGDFFQGAATRITDGVLFTQVDNIPELGTEDGKSTEYKLAEYFGGNLDRKVEDPTPEGFVEEVRNRGAQAYLQGFTTDENQKPVLGAAGAYGIHDDKLTFYSFNEDSGEINSETEEL